MKSTHILPEPRLGSLDLFPTLRPTVFLNHAAISPPSTAVQHAITKCLEDYGARGVDAVMDWIEQRENLRQKLADLIGAPSASEIAYLSNTTSGAVAIAQCMDWKAGDRIVLFEGEFPANTVPWQRAAETFELEIIWVSARETVDSNAQNLAELLDDRVRLVAASFVQFQTGWRMPLAAISKAAKAVDARVFVDGIQGIGGVPFNAAELGVDFVACGGHKWLMSVEGAGFLWVSQKCWDDLVPRLAGWLSTEEPLKFLFEGPGELRYNRKIRREPNFLEFGATNALGYAGLDAAVTTLQTLSIDAIWTHITAWLDALDHGLETTRMPQAQSGILSVRPPTGWTHSTFKDALGQQGVAVSTPDGYVRFAPHWPNGIDQVDHVLAACRTILF